MPRIQREATARTWKRPGRLATMLGAAWVLAFIWAGGLAGCSSGTEPQPAEETPAATPEPAAEAPVPMPAPNAEAVWAYLEKAPYDQWPMWPGKEAFYEGTEPHGALLTTYVNQAAADAINGQAATLPPGAIIVKENYTPDRTLAAVTVMYKSEGFDPEHHDWFWMKRLADGTVESSGSVETCQSCHVGEGNNDYIRGATLMQQ